ncbi:MULTISPECIES: tRNA (adenosine(37)-N6)-threonylcarbamoyltransferase complex dimerization subunit type 1 TsaB [unclassified Psychrobacter]|uniref:tRNA (adenosine(37)-N6)-threonylcarbamoyltransferase complex dimerization subunit type 1 TsaB n=1 Tax=unclassified Psychrobacter TaxID=196806 RepID=UPI0018F3D1FA|nr:MULTISPECIES: tRNA (adenosine(37)-N6)-threonylcarbamoyltransferase complex dimerization subunit type 1 TsaB [unclassified Psychrobacter]
MFLAIDTVFDQCSVALLDASGKVLNEDTKRDKRQQTQQILPMIDALLSAHNSKLSDIQALFFNRGPGAFSGIRINTAVVQALSVAQDIPCVGVSSLQAIAQQTYSAHQVTELYSAHDARMSQVYFGQYALQAGIMQPVAQKDAASDEDADTERLLDYDTATKGALPIAGDGAPLLATEDGQTLYPDIIPTAAVIGILGYAEFHATGGVSAGNALPKYLRNKAWKTLKEQGKA